MRSLPGFLKTLLRGTSQVFLQNNPLTGLLFLMGIFLNSWIMGVGAVLGLIAGTLAAFLLKLDAREISDGLYGFNGVLVGTATLFFFEFTPMTVILLIAGAVLSTLIMRLFLRMKIPPYTFPFVLSAWILFFLINSLGLAASNKIAVLRAISLNAVNAATLGLGQVMFQASLIAGIFFFFGLLVTSRKAAAFGLLGAVLGGIVALLLSLPLGLVNLGIFGYNGVLCGIAFSDSKKRALPFAVIAIVLSVGFLYGMQTLGVVALTAPFVFATWLTLGFTRLVKPEKN